LNVNGLNFPTKRHRVVEWILKRPTAYCHQGNYFSFTETHRLKVKRWKKDIPCKWKLKERRQKSDKINFRSDCSKELRRSFYSDKGANISREYSNCK
jgi:hypothetical protein